MAERLEVYKCALCGNIVEVLDGGLGSVDLPSNLVRVSGSGDAQEGVWEVADFDSATYKIVIIISHVGPGSINIQ